MANCFSQIEVRHLRDGLGMIVNGVGQFTVVVEDEPASLPSLRPVYRVGEVPVGSYKQVAAPAHSDDQL